MTEVSDFDSSLRVPACIGLIIDGNRRYAREKNIAPERAHYVGYEKLKEFVRWAKDAGVKTLIVYTFSTENWQRPQEEVNILLDLIRMTLTTELKELVQKNVRLRVIGDTARFPADIQNMISAAEQKTAGGTEGTLVLALSYGGRSEILAAAQKLAELPADERKNITEEEFSRFLWTHDISDPEIIIRTGGHKRLSNFLPWQSTYSEFFFTDTQWPAFTKKEFEEILREYTTVVQNNGK